MNGTWEGVEEGKIATQIAACVFSKEGESTISRGQNEKTKTDRRMVYTEP